MRKKILVIFIWVIGFSAVGVLFGFVNNERKSLVCKGAEVTIVGDTALHFFSKNEMLDLLSNKGIQIKNQKISSINLLKAESFLKEHPAVENAEVYTTLDGILKINITKREPLLRIIDFSRDDYYIDKKGFYMPIISGFSAYVPVVTGVIFDNWHKYTKSVQEIEKNDSIANLAVTDDLYYIITEIQKDTMLSALAVQFYVNQNRDIEMIPRVGPEVIILGDKANLNAKLERLKLFYKEGLKYAGWDKYSSINLKYSNQIVCTKKTE